MLIVLISPINCPFGLPVVNDTSIDMNLVAIGIHLSAQVFHNICVGYHILLYISLLDDVIMDLQAWVVITLNNDVTIFNLLFINDLSYLL